MSGDKTHPLDACPFCGNNEFPRICQTLGNCVDVCCVAAVGGCGASTGHYKTEAEAIAAWNRRSRPTLAPHGLPPAGLREAAEIQGAADLVFELAADICSEHCDLDPEDQEKMAHCSWCDQATKAYQSLKAIVAAERERGGEG